MKGIARMIRPPHLRRPPLIALPIAMLAAMLGLGPTNAATYHVDFASGSDQASGLTPETAWKRAPGDSRAGTGPRSVRLQPGDTILFRGGVAYRGTIVVRASGTADAPIRYVGDAWGPAPAILDGAEPAADTRPCRSARDCGGAADWQVLHRVSPGGDAPHSDPIFQQDRLLSVGPADAPLAPGAARPMAGSGRHILLVRPNPGVAPEFARSAGRVGFLLVAGSHVEIRGFQPTRFAAVPRLGPYAGHPLVALQPVAGLSLTALPPGSALRKAAPIGPAIAGVTSGPI